MATVRAARTASVVILAVGAVALTASPAWAGTLLFDSNRGAGEFGAYLWRVGDDGSNLRQLTFHGGYTNGNPDYFAGPRLSPDGRHLLLARSTGPVDSQLVVTDLDGRNARPIAGEQTGYAWSPDGRSVVFSAATRRAGGYDEDIYLVNADGGNLHRVISGPTNEDSARFSPDGRRIEFWRTGSPPYVYGPFGKDGGHFSTALDGSDQRRLSIGNGSHEIQSPDGRYVADFIDGQLFTMTASGEQLTAWTPPRTIYGPDNFVWSAAGPTFFFAATPPGRQRALTGIYRADLSAPGVVRMLVPPDSYNTYLNWTDGRPHALPHLTDVSAPAAMLIGRRQRPVGAPRSAGRVRPSRRAPVVDRKDLGVSVFDPSGIRRVQIAVARRAGRKRGHALCRFLARKRYSRRRRCTRPVFRAFRSDAELRSGRHLRRGISLIGLRARDGRGNATRARPKLRAVRLR